MKSKKLLLILIYENYIILLQLKNSFKLNLSKINFPFETKKLKNKFSCFLRL